MPTANGWAERKVPTATEIGYSITEACTHIGAGILPRIHEIQPLEFQKRGRSGTTCGAVARTRLELQVQERHIESEGIELRAVAKSHSRTGIALVPEDTAVTKPHVDEGL